MIHCQPIALEFDSNGQRRTYTPTLIRDEQDTILVDCGQPNMLPLLEEALRREGVAPGSITKVVITHHDVDHIGSLAALKGAYPQISIIAHEIEVPYIEGKQKLLRLEQAEANFDALPEEARPNAKQFIQRLRSVEPAAVDRTVTDGERLPWCGGIDVVYTPGHLPGHTSLYVPSVKTVIAGDAAIVSEGKLELPNPQFTLDMDEAIRSLRRLLDYDIERIVCYHGGLFEGDVNQAIRQLVSA